MTGLALRHVNLPARDPEGLARWYADRLGLEARGTHVVGPLALLVFEPGEPMDPGANAHFGFRVETREEVDDWARRFDAPLEADPDYAGFKVRDPEGNRFEIYWEAPD